MKTARILGRHLLSQACLTTCNNTRPANARPVSDPEDLTIQSLAYYTLCIVAAEWVEYVGVMQYCFKQYEYNHSQLPTLSLDKFDKDPRELQSWRRRTMVS
ncbi:hypothetical protein K491DRAFT_716595 [Lophiostoma macrostomum CBS 122681]|uniref:Uncharacterized protein n=1 Tax=Lophiostoma macrostomum CBS 122681 TaxID=1314788 RepID=A0A6A6T5Q7_9PLEO|nr:hypothetical protein K491DRAFT_716595 [Lophiostoma macrostomum CBS 122681]